MKVLVFQSNSEDGEWKEIPNTLEALQETVGGYIEVAPLAADVVAICDEEGRLKGKEANKTFPSLVGDVIVCGVKGEDFISLTPNHLMSLMMSMMGLTTATE